MGLYLTVSSACKLEVEECGALREFIGDIVEKTSNPDYVTMTIVTHASGGLETISGTCEETLDQIDDIECEMGSDVETDYDSALEQGLTALVGSSLSYDENKLVELYCHFVKLMILMIHVIH